MLHRSKRDSFGTEAPTSPLPTLPLSCIPRDEAEATRPVNYRKSKVLRFRLTHIVFLAAGISHIVVRTDHASLKVVTLHTLHQGTLYMLKRFVSNVNVKTYET